MFFYATYGLYLLFVVHTPVVCIDLSWSNTAQAQTEDYKRQIEELSARLSNLSAEKANLESRNSLLVSHGGLKHHC